MGVALLQWNCLAAAHPAVHPAWASALEMRRGAVSLHTTFCFGDFSFLTLLILFSGQEPQLDKQLIDYLEIGPTFLNSSGTFPALLHTCWCTVTFLILYIKLFCEHVLAIKDCNLGWAISLGSSHSLVIVPGLNIFEPAGLLGLFKIISIHFWGSGADAPFQALDMLFHAAGKADSLTYKPGSHCSSFWWPDI